MLRTIGQIAVPVKDLERAITFYRDTLGMKFLFQAPPALAFFDCDGIRLLLDQPADRKFANHSSIIYYRVADIDATYRALEERGVAFNSEPHVIHRTDKYELRLCDFHDSEGNSLALMSETGSLL
jgi:methylmalonyl-CoA/ethylmalonyl-CoA epimerase